MDVLLYSKYSNASKQLMSQLQKTPELIDSLTLTCIDNKDIRQRILNDQKIKIKTIPCLIRLNDETNNFDIFEGHTVFDFFTSLQESIKRKQEMEALELRKQEMEVLELRKQEMEALELRKKELERREQELKVQEDEDIEFIKKKEINPKKTEKNKGETILSEAKRQEAERQEAHRIQSQKYVKFENTNQEPKTTKPKISTSIHSDKISFTPIDDLDIDMNEEPVINTYMHVEKTENSEFNDREIGAKHAETAVTKSTGSLLSKAMKMQKERDMK